MPGAPIEDGELSRRLGQGDRLALGELFARHRDRLRLMVGLRLAPRLHGRIDPSDVIQEAFVEAAARFEQYHRDPSMPVFLWLRFLTAQKLAELHRHHLKVRARDARREVPLGREASIGVSSAVLAARLLGRLTTPSGAAVRAERRQRVEAALEAMDPIDREVLVLRHFEQLSNAEAAHVLGLAKSGASSRYVRALQRLRALLADAGGDLP